MEKLNIAELLKDCPQGMKLDCPLFENLEFDHIDKDNKLYPIICRVKTEWGSYNFYTFTEYGRYCSEKYSKCVIFPKDKTTWEGFVPPCKFNDGDIVASNDDRFIGIVKYVGKDWVYTYCAINKVGSLTANFPYYFHRFATEEEKAKLFQAIKGNGLKWNAETKTLEKLVEPKFKVGDIITKRDSIENSWVVSSVSSEYYGLQLPKGSEGIGTLPIIDQDKYELIPNKFDITTLKPFESKVLVRNSDVDSWCPAIFGCKRSTYTLYKYATMAENYYAQCIPYKGNEYLLGTTDDCDEYYKTWE